MKTKLAAFLFVATLLQSSANSLSRDRAAILAMAGSFEVDFNFTETVALASGYELKKPYQAKAHELVKVAEDKGSQITLQHLLVIDGDLGLTVIKHWAQVWTYEDPRSLTYEGNKTWLPINHTPEETKGTWTQLVTQTDDSPRYKAQGNWSHAGNSSTWTSKSSTRPLPRRDYTKRSDYDLLVVVNHHIVTPDGWVHQQDNRKLVSRDGKSQFLCVESGLNKYRRITDDTKKEGFQLAESEWKETQEFWGNVRHTWLGILKNSSKPIHYAARLNGKRLGSEMNSLAEESTKKGVVNKEEINQLVARYLR